MKKLIDMTDSELREACKMKGITDANRGHRPRLSPSEPTELYGLKLPLSLKLWALEQGPVKIRQILTEAKQTRKENEP